MHFALVSSFALAALPLLAQASEGVFALEESNLLATRTTDDLPYNVEMPGASPVYNPRAPAEILPISDILPWLGACDFLPTSQLYYASASKLGKRQVEFGKRQLLGGLVGGKKTTSTSAKTSSVAVPSSSTAVPSSSVAVTSAAIPSTSAAAANSMNNVAGVTCVGTSGNEQTINSLLSMGGAGTTVYLCPSNTIKLSNPIQFTAANQTLTTRGAPTDDTRAILLVTGVTQTNAITSSCAACSGVALRNIQVNGNRPALGFIAPNAGGSALLEVGGTNQGQIIDNIKAFEPRSWSTLHGIEGTANSCSGMIITNNQLGPAGNGPSGSQQNRRRASSYVPVGQWADGISLACRGSTVTGNTITDATDGAIVIFGAPGSQVTSNTIVQNNRVTMGGVNMVDLNPYSGSFAGTVVSQNTFFANTSMIKVGIAIGQMVWSSDNKTSDRTSMGLVTSNLFKSGPGTGATPGYFGFGIAVAGHNNANVPSGNVFQNANFGGVPSGSCTSTLPPVPGPLFYDPQTTPGRNLQPDFQTASLCFIVCIGPTTSMSRIGFSSA